MNSWSTGLFYGSLAVTSISSLTWLLAVFYRRLAKLIPVMMALSWGLLSLSIVMRAVVTDHGPFSNIYEFSLAFAWGIISLGLLLWWRNRLSLIIGLTAILSLAVLAFAATLSSRVISLIPALQQSVLLSLHVTAAVIAYGAFAIGFGIAVAYLIRERHRPGTSSESNNLDLIGYQAVIIGFPFMTLTIILGAVWAEIAWGRYWGWDPKETASLVTWLLYAGYLHARIIRGWRGKRAAVLLIIGFCAVLFTFFGNYIFQGLHSYR
jgi:cytochrome c-type biogenesis protein CcsB